jgi:hypothetical protein
MSSRSGDINLGLAVSADPQVSLIAASLRVLAH